MSQQPLVRVKNLKKTFSNKRVAFSKKQLVMSKHVTA